MFHVALPFAPYFFVHAEVRPGRGWGPRPPRAAEHDLRLVARSPPSAHGRTPP